VVGAFIGDGLGLGPHWYYDLEELRERYGSWITGYTDPHPGHYHEGMKAGDLSQTGLIMEMLLDSLVSRGGYDEADFCRRLDEDLLSQMDGRAKSGPGGYSNHSFRQVWHARVREGKPWGQVAGNADTSEGAERVALLAARYAMSPREVDRYANSCCRLAQSDSLVVQQSVAFALVLAALVRGEAFDENISDKLMAEVESGEVPFLANTSIAAA
jgi:ADP-ribosylglycohydrolase